MHNEEEKFNKKKIRETVEVQARVQKLISHISENNINKQWLKVYLIIQFEYLE